MTRTIRTDYQAVNGSGVVVFTFGDRESGRAWVRENACRHDGLILEQVEITARPVYRPRTVRPAHDFQIPAYG